MCISVKFIKCIGDVITLIGNVEWEVDNLKKLIDERWNRGI